MLHRTLFNTLLQYNDGTKQINCFNRNVIEYPEILNEMYYRQMLLNQSFIEWKAEKGIKWLIGFSNYLNKNARKKFDNELIYRTYSFGEIIDVDFFGGFTNELTYDHPAIVLKDVGVGLIIAPITSSEKVFKNPNPVKTHIRLGKNAMPHGYMKKNSTIKLEQVRYISKARVLRLKKREKEHHITGEIIEIEQKVKDITKVKEIKWSLAKFLSNDTIYDFEQAISSLEISNAILLETEKNLVSSIGEKDEKIMQLEEQLFELNQKVVELESQLAEVTKKV